MKVTQTLGTDPVTSPAKIKFQGKESTNKLCTDPSAKGSWSYSLACSTHPRERPGTPRICGAGMECRMVENGTHLALAAKLLKKMKKGIRS